MTTKKKTSKKSDESKQSKIKNVKLQNDLTAIILIGLSILVLVGFFTDKTGLIGNTLNSMLFLLFGNGSYVIPLLAIYISTLILMGNHKKTQILSIIILFLSLLIILDGTNNTSLNLIQKIRFILNNPYNQINGGIIGGLFGFTFYKLFGNIGTYLIISFISVITIIALIGKENFLNFYNENIKIKIKKTKNNEIEKVSENANNDQSKVIEVRDYSTLEVSDNLSKEINKLMKERKKDDKVLISNSTEDKQRNNLNYSFPPIDLLNDSINKGEANDKKEIINNAKIIEETMKNFGIDAKVTHVNIGPSITCYELTPAPGIKLSKIVSLSDNISLSLAMPDIRIEAPIPGKSAVGIEVPNKFKDMVTLKDMLSSKEFKESASDLSFVLGKDITGKVIVSDIQKMPHLLIAGATGSGKSVCINTIIMSLLYKNSPENVKMLLIDPKVVELNVYNGIPHLLIPVVTEPKKAAQALNWAVGEMERRYKLFAQNNVRDIQSYNKKFRNTDNKLPKIIIIIDELADLMMVSANEVEDYIARLAQMARAAGMHLIVATQRPSVDVITGTIKANIPSRISFAVSSQVDSRTILDMAGAEKLLGQGDMLFYPSSMSKPIRIQGAFVSNEEVERIVEYLKEDNEISYDNEIIEKVTNKDNPFQHDSDDELLKEAIELVVLEQTASISLLQRKFKIGYARAARLIDSMEELGIIGGYEGSKPRKVLLTEDDLEEKI